MSMSFETWGGGGGRGGGGGGGPANRSAAAAAGSSASMGRGGRIVSFGNYGGGVGGGGGGGGEWSNLNSAAQTPRSTVLQAGGGGGGGGGGGLRIGFTGNGSNAYHARGSNAASPVPFASISPTHHRTLQQQPYTPNPNPSRSQLGGGFLSELPAMQRHHSSTRLQSVSNSMSFGRAGPGASQQWGHSMSPSVSLGGFQPPPQKFVFYSDEYLKSQPSFQSALSSAVAYNRKNLVDFNPLSFENVKKNAKLNGGDAKGGGGGVAVATSKSKEADAIPKSDDEKGANNDANDNDDGGGGGFVFDFAAQLAKMREESKRKEAERDAAQAQQEKKE